MLQVLIGVPPTYHPKAMAPGEIIAFLITVGVLFVGVLITTIILEIVGRKRTRALAQTKKSELIAAQKEPEPEDKPQESAPEEEKKEPPVQIPSLT